MIDCRAHAGMGCDEYDMWQEAERQATEVQIKVVETTEPALGQCLRLAGDEDDGVHNIFLVPQEIWDVYVAAQLAYKNARRLIGSQYGVPHLGALDAR